MATERTSPQNDALVMIFLRQTFYNQQLQLILGAFLLAVLLIIVLIGMLVYLFKHPVHPIYFETDKEGRLVVELPLNVPNMTTEDVTAWVTHAVQAAYSYDFMNYRKQLQSAQKYFTNYGWRQYLKGLQASNNLLALTQHRMVVLASVVETPKLVIKGNLAGRYAWKFEMPVLVTYLEPPYDEQSKFSNPLIVSVVVERQQLMESDHGLGIVQIIGNLAISAPEQNINPGGAS